MSPGASIGWVGAASLLLAGCASIQPERADALGERIVYETSPEPFCGRCETLKLAVWSDGHATIERGRWAGRYSAWTVRRQSLQVSPEQITQFRERLAPYRPIGSAEFRETPDCETYTNDLPQIT